MKFSTTLVPIAFLAISACNQTPKTTTPETTIPKTAPPDSAKLQSFVRPPLDSVDVPYREYSVDAAKGDSLSYPTGSTLLFPPDAFVDKAGNIVQGKITIHYREFIDPIDFYLAGIPMTYDSAGENYMFSSSGMCEILAYKEGQPVYVNPKSKPRINLAVRGSAANANLYYLDTTRRNWVYKEAGHPPVAIRKTRSKLQAMDPAAPLPAKPVRPEKADYKSPVIRLVVDTTTFGELKAYNNLRFQLEDGGRRFNPKDTGETWNNVELKRGKDSTSYIATFSNPSRTVSYAVRPVLEEKDYPAAMQAFVRQTEYYNRIMQRRAQARHIDDSTKAFADRWLEPEKATLARLRARYGPGDQRVKSQQAFVDALIDQANSSALIRSFALDGFGTWNCDRATIMRAYTFHAQFIDSSGHPIKVTNIAVLYPLVNGLVRFLSDTISIDKQYDFMIAGTFYDRFAFISTDQCKKIHIDANTKEATFPMTIIAEKDYRRISAAARGWSAQ